MKVCKCQAIILQSLSRQKFRNETQSLDLRVRAKKITREDLAERVCDLSNDALIQKVTSGDLTVLAHAVALEELKTRGTT